MYPSPNSVPDASFWLLVMGNSHFFFLKGKLYSYINSPPSCQRLSPLILVFEAPHIKCTMGMEYQRIRALVFCIQPALAWVDVQKHKPRLLRSPALSTLIALFLLHTFSPLPCLTVTVKFLKAGKEWYLQCFVSYCQCLRQLTWKCTLSVVHFKCGALLFLSRGKNLVQFRRAWVF